jgi:predicted Zn-dependent peptidase
MQKTVFDNGIKVLTKKNPNIRSVSVGIWVNVGARDEKISENGLSHFIEHMLFKGTRNRSAFKIAKDFDSLGSQVNAFTTMENTCLHGKVIDSGLEKLVLMMGDIFLNSLFPESEIENEKPVVLQEIGMIDENPEDLLHSVNDANLWGDHPLGRSILGTKESVQSFSAKDITNFYKNKYRPEDIIISAAGNVSHEEFVTLVKPLFEKLESGQVQGERKAPEIKTGIDVVTKDIEQAHICINGDGLKSSDPDRFALSLMNVILGGNMSSRLFQKIREENGLAYSVYSYSTSNTDSGMLGTYLAVNPTNVIKAFELTLSELRTIRDCEVKDVELKNAKEYLKGNVYLSSESSENTMFRLVQNELYFNRFVPIEEIIGNIEKVAVKDVIELSQRLLAEKNLSATVLGPFDDIQSIKSMF